MDRLTAEELADYLIEIGGTLVSYGCPSYRLEQLIAVVAELEGLKAQAFAMPTGLFVTVTETDLTPLPLDAKSDRASLPPLPPIAPIVRMVRVKEWGTNLDRLVGVDQIFNEVAEKKLTIRQARRRLRALERTPPPYPPALRWIAAAVVAASAAVFFRGGVFEVSVAAFTGLLVFGLSLLMAKNPSGRFLVDFAGGMLAAGVAWGASRIRPDFSREVVVLSGIIALVPGMTLTTGLAELAQRNLVSGGARLMEAFVAFLSILFGIALVIGVQHMVGIEVSFAPARHGLGLPFQAAALVGAALAFAVLFAVPRRYVWAAVASGAIGYIATALGTRHLPGHIAAFAAALAISLFSNLFARATDRPAQLFQLPGMMLLVPGSFGFLSLEGFLRGDYLDGAAKGFSMILIAGALVTGVLVANVVLPARKVL